MLVFLAPSSMNFMIRPVLSHSILLQHLCKQERFMRAYKVVSEKVFSKKNIRNACLGAGIYLTSSQRALRWVLEYDAHRQQSPPITPKRSKEASFRYFYTLQAT